ncbi:MAG: hypothetical protein HC813_02255 [Planctomycetes bacterium]|nr:hypothetical protein [Planctomycetota bacterium]
MKFKVGTVRGVDAIVLFRAEGVTSKVPVGDSHLAKEAASAMKAGEFAGKAGETLLLRGGKGGLRLLLAGLGERSKITDDSFRAAAAGAARLLDAKGSKRACFLLPPDRDPEIAARSVVEAAGLGCYVFDACKSTKVKPKLVSVTVAPESGRAKAALGKGVKEGAAIVASVAFARDLGNLPPNIAHAVYLAKRARELQGGPMRVVAHTRAQILKLKMGRLRRRRPGEQARAPTHRDPLPGRRREEPHLRHHREGGHIRHRRRLDQALPGHGRDEIRHVRGCRGAGLHASGEDAPAQGESPRPRARHRQHARRRRLPPGRHRHRAQRQDDRDPLDRCGGAPAPLRRPLLCGGEEARPHDRPRDLDRRLRRRPRG